MALKVITDHKYKNILYGYELSEKEKNEFDYIPADDIDCHSFIRYKGIVYDLSEFMALNNMIMDDKLSEWHGYQSDSYFSGIVVKYSDDYEQVMIGTYIS